MVMTGTRHSNIITSMPIQMVTLTYNAPNIALVTIEVFIAWPAHPENVTALFVRCSSGIPSGNLK
jgi:hypothetical protein